MNSPSDIQSQHAKWMEVIVVWLGIFTFTKTVLFLSSSLQYSRSTPEIISNSFCICTLLMCCMILLLKYQALPSWILNSSTTLGTRGEITEENNLEWLTIGIFTLGFLFLVHTIPTMCSVLGSNLSLWFTPNREAIGMTEEKLWFYIATFLLNFLPKFTMALFFTFFSQSAATWTLSCPKWRGN